MILYLLPIFVELYEFTLIDFFFFFFFFKAFKLRISKRINHSNLLLLFKNLMLKKYLIPLCNVFQSTDRKVLNCYIVLEFSFKVQVSIID